MRKLLLIFALAGFAQAQNVSVSWLQFLNSAGTHYLRLTATGTAANHIENLVLSGSGPWCSDGSGTTTIGGSCGSGGVASVNNTGSPGGITVSPTTGNVIIQTTQNLSSTGSPSFINLSLSSGAAASIMHQTSNSGLFRYVSQESGGSARWIFGTDNTAESGANAGSNWFLNRYSDAGSLLDTVLAINRSSGTATFADTVGFNSNTSTLGTAIFSGLVTQGGGTPLWYIQANGVSFARNYTSRYTFNSMGDVAQTGTLTLSSGVATLSTGGPFDVSFAGGQLGLCPVTCTAGNSTQYLVSNSPAPTGTSLTLVSPPANGTYSFTYSANAFQTSQGTMHCDGTGFCYFQNLAVTNGFTAYGTGTLSGTVNISSGTIVYNGTGNTFNQSMVGGTMVVSAVSYPITGFLTPTKLTTSNPGTVSNGTYTYAPDTFRIWNGSSVPGRVTAAGDATFHTLSTAQNVDVGNSLTMGGVLAIDNGGGGHFSTINASGAITVASCSGCGGSGTVTSVATTAPISGGPITTTGTISCSTCVRTSGHVGLITGSAQFPSSGTTQNVSTGFTTNGQCWATIDNGTGAGVENISNGANSGGTHTFVTNVVNSNSFFDWGCTGTP